MEVTPGVDVQAADILAKEGISAEVNKYLNREFPCFLVHCSGVRLESCHYPSNLKPLMTVLLCTGYKSPFN